jgi:hypothetical protein
LAVYCRTLLQGAEQAPARDLVSIDYIAAVTAMLTLVGAELITGDVM